MFNLRIQSAISCLFLTWGLICGRASASPSIVLSLTSGPPTTKFLVSGQGFSPGATVEILFDTKNEGLVTADNTGSFTGPVQAPKDAPPGTNWVSAVEQNSGIRDKKRFLVETDWITPGFTPNHTGVNPYENVLSPETVSGLQLRWAFVSGNQYVWGTPIVVGATAYIATSPYLYAIDANSGVLRWTASANDLFAASPTAVDGKLYMGTFDTGVHVFDARTGKPIWSYPASARVYSTPVVADGMVYFGDNFYGIFYALDASSGIPRWTFGTSYLTVGAAVANGVVYFGDDFGEFYALNASTGETLWQSNFGADYVFSSAPAVVDGVVYVGVLDQMYALNASTGAVLWTYTAGGNVVTSAAVADDVVYFGAYDSNMYAVNALTGAELWSNATGTRLGSSPVVANGVVYGGNFDGTIFALDAQTGSSLWSYNTGTVVESSPTVVNGVLYVGLGNNREYAFGLKQGLNPHPASQ
jgi:outer membrane protein assembly factor BamB